MYELGVADYQPCDVDCQITVTFQVVGDCKDKNTQDQQQDRIERGIVHPYAIDD